MRGAICMLNLKSRLDIQGILQEVGKTAGKKKIKIKESVQS